MGGIAPSVMVIYITCRPKNPVGVPRGARPPEVRQQHDRDETDQHDQERGDEPAMNDQAPWSCPQTRMSIVDLMYRQFGP